MRVFGRSARFFELCDERFFECAFAGASKKRLQKTKTVAQTAVSWYNGEESRFGWKKQNMKKDMCVPSKEHLKWVSLDEDVKLYPEFFRAELKNPTDTIKHFVKDER